MKAVSTNLVFIMIGEVQKGTQLTCCLPLYCNIHPDLIAGPGEDEKRCFAESWESGKCVLQGPTHIDCAVP